MREGFAFSEPSDAYRAQEARQRAVRDLLMLPARLLGMRTDDFAGLGAAIFSVVVWALLAWLLLRERQ